jgi:RHS repeat-associated protein
MGDMTCRDVDTTVGSTQACDASQTGALMSYDNEGRLSSWTAAGAATPSDQFLYDNAGNRVLQRINNGMSSPTDIISFSGCTDGTINGGQTSTTKYYSAGGKMIAMSKDGVISYLLPDTLGSVSLTLYADGSTESVQLYAPYGVVRYSNGSIPTAYGFTGQRFDSTTGLMYYGARYYDPVSGRFISPDSVVTNASGQDPYAYVGGNPETATDPTGNNGLCPNAATSNAIPCGGGGNVDCVFELGCGGGSTYPGPSNYAANTPMPATPSVGCDGSCQIALLVLMLGINAVAPESIPLLDPEVLAGDGALVSRPMHSRFMELFGEAFFCEGERSSLVRT